MRRQGSTHCMIEINQENCVRLSEVPHYLPPARRGKRVHVSTVFRWAQRGVRGIKLETIRIGGALHTSLEAIQRFAERCSGTDAKPSTRTAHWRKKQISKAERELDALGI